MANMYDSGLFSELGDLLGHDPTFYEEYDVSSSPGDIRKHSYITTSPITTSPITTSPYNNEIHPKGMTEVLEPLSSTPSNSVGEMESLLSEGNMLLDRLMAENGLDLLTAPVELADVDELIAVEEQFCGAMSDTNPISDMFTNFYEPADETCQMIPESPISTLPSEPSSPVDWFDLESAVAAAAAPVSPVVGGGSSSSVDELDDLLSSLLDEGTAPQSSEDYLYDDKSAYSPASSSGSDYSYNGQASDITEEDNSLSSYTGSPAPAKSKTPRKKKSSTPYSKLPANRKEKKKLQNKEAAIRYRQKKKGETQVLVDEETQLQDKNDTLRAEVLNLEREILCMKELLSDVFNVHSI